MRRRHPFVLWGLFTLLGACATVPYTHREQFAVMPESQMTSLGTQAYTQILSKAKVDHDPKVNSLVDAVGERLAKVADHPEYKWQFTVIDDPKTANAFALPGGKVAVYTGLFPVVRTTAGLAAVLGHEIGHVLAHHANERMSQNLIVQILGGGLSVALGSQNAATRDAVMQAFGLGAQVGVLLPFSRTQEAEADHIGLILMAKAGYDPHAALDLWKRFEKLGKQTPPEFLSTHPSYGTREHNIETWLPEAMRYYDRSPHAKVLTLPTVSAAGAQVPRAK